MSCGAQFNCDSCVRAGCSWVLQTASSWCTKDLNGIIGEFTAIDSQDTILCQFLPDKEGTRQPAPNDPAPASQPETFTFSSGFLYGIGFWMAALFLFSWTIFSFIFMYNLCAEGDNWSNRFLRRCRQFLTAIWTRIFSILWRRPLNVNLRTQVRGEPNDAFQAERDAVNELVEMDNLSSPLRLFVFNAPAASSSQARASSSQPLPIPPYVREDLERELSTSQSEDETSFETTVRLNADSRVASAIAALRNADHSPKKTRSGQTY